MKSKITIELNFDEGNLPVIRVLSQSSDDVRDKLISSFLQSLQHTSRWCKIIYMGNRSPLRPPDDLQDAIHCWHIVPIKPDEIQSEMDLMWSLINSQKEVSSAVSPTVGHSFGDKVGESQYREMIYQRNIQNPYSTDGQQHVAYEKGFEDCYTTFSKAEKIK